MSLKKNRRGGSALRLLLLESLIQPEGESQPNQPDPPGNVLGGIKHETNSLSYLSITH